MTSIELFIEELKELKLIREDLKTTLSLLIGKYKEMHKQEIIDAVGVGSQNDDISFQTERMYSEEEVIEFGEMIAWNMVGKTITESFIRTLSRELFKQFKKD